MFPVILTMKKTKEDTKNMIIGQNIKNYIMKIFKLLSKLKVHIKKVIFELYYNYFIQYNNLENVEHIFTHLTREEKYKLYQLARSKKGNFVEIGSYLGASSCYIACALKNNDKLYCIDTWENDSMSEGKRDTYNEFIKNTIRFKHVITPIRVKSIEATKICNDKIDFLFIDGDHSYEGVKADVNSWFPKLNKNALVVFHDTGWAEGVQRIIQEEVMGRIKKSGRLPNMWWGWTKD